MDGGPWRLTVVTSPDECNLACTMCATHAPEVRAAGRVPFPPRRLSLAQVSEALAGAPATLAEVIPSTRGEPLLWDGLAELAGICRRRGLRLNVTTNGTWPGAGAEAWARALVPACSDVKVSWAAAAPEIDRALLGGRDPGRALEGLRTLLRVRDEVERAAGHHCGVSLQVAVREENVEDLPALVRLAATEGVDRVKLNHLQVRFPSLRGSSLAATRGGIERWNRAVAACRDAVASAPRRGGGRLEVTPLAELPPGGDRPPAGDCPFVGREAWLEVDGRFLPCPSPAAREGALGAFGRLGEVTFAEAWTGPAWRGLAAGWRDRAPCRDCPFRRPGGA